MMELVKIHNNLATFRIGSMIITESLDNEASLVLNYYNKIPSND